MTTEKKIIEVNDNDGDAIVETEVLSDDEAILQQFFALIEEGNIEINTGFIPDDEGKFTHQVLRITCGEYISVSQPEPLHVPLIPAGAPAGETVN